MSSKIERLEAALERARIEARLENLSPNDAISIIRTVVDGAVRGDNRVPVTIRKSVARCARHWSTRGRLRLVSRELTTVDGDKITAGVWQWIDPPSPSPVECVQTWHAMRAETRLAWYDCAARLDKYMPIELDRAISRAPADTGARE